MNLPHPARTFLFLAVAACAWSIPKAQAALLVYEPFEYSSTQGQDLNGDGKTDLMGLNGGIGWGNAWSETTGTVTDLANYPLDYIQNGSLAGPLGQTDFGTGNSLRIYGQTESAGIFQGSNTLSRSLAEPIRATAGTSLWFSVALRKDGEQKDGSEQTRASDRLEIALLNSSGAEIRIMDPSDSTSYKMASPWGENGTGELILDGSGPSLGTTDFLMLKLTLESGGKSRLDFFLNPSLDAEPTVPNLSSPLSDGVLLAEFTELQIYNGTSRASWTLDEIRIGESYHDVVPEPSSLLLASFGIGALGLSRSRRSQIARN